MAENKTKPTGESVTEFLNALPDERIRDECKAVSRIMQKVTGAKPKMWRGGLIGFGTFAYKSASGRGGDWMLTALRPGKGKFTVYVMPGFPNDKALKKQLGKTSGGLSCIHIRHLSDIHQPTLVKMLKASIASLKKKWPQ